MNTNQRLTKVRRIIYLGEEEATLAGGDWDKLRNAVRMCAALAEATGRGDEDQAHEVTDRWVNSKLRHIRYLERILVSVPRPSPA